MSAIIDQAISPTRRRKLSLMLRERALVLGWRLRRGPSDDVVAAERADEYRWDYEARVAVPEGLFRSAHAPRLEDTWEDGHVVRQLEYRVSRLAGATLHTNGSTHVSVYGADGRWLPRYSRTKYLRARPARRDLPVTREVPGRTVSLFGNVENVTGNYGHWLVDAVARVFLADRFVERSSVDHFLVPRLRHEFQRESLEAIGVPRERLIELDPLDVPRFEELVCTTPPRGQGSAICPGWVVDAFRAALGVEATGGPGAKLYISRRDAPTRNFVNEAELEAVFAERGYESVALAEHDFAAKVALFAGADTVVGLPGAGMTNVMFSPRGSMLLELMPDHFAHYMVASIAGHLDIDYRHLSFSNPTLTSRLNRYFGDLRVDVRRVADALDDLADRRAGGAGRPVAAASPGLGTDLEATGFSA